MAGSTETGYSTSDVSQLLGLEPRQVRALLDDRIVEPEQTAGGESRFSFQDLVMLRAAIGLREARVPRRRIRSAIAGLRHQLPADAPATGVRIFARGGQVVAQQGGSMWNPESGQELIDFSVDDNDPSAVGATPPPRVETQPAVAEPSSEPSADDWFELGCELETSSQPDARAAYLRALELDSSHLDAHLNLGRLHHEAHEVEAAEHHYRAALEIAAGDATAAFNLGVALEDLGRDVEALAAYEQAIAADPKSADAYYNAARLYERRGERASAFRCLRTYRSLCG